MGLVARIRSEGWNFQSHPRTSGERGEVRVWKLNKSLMANDWINCSSEMKPA